MRSLTSPLKPVQNRMAAGRYALYLILFSHCLRRRDAGYPAPPAQPRTCSFPASGSSVVLTHSVIRDRPRFPVPIRETVVCPRYSSDIPRYSFLLYSTYRGATELNGSDPFSRLILLVRLGFMAPRIKYTVPGTRSPELEDLTSLHPITWGSARYRT
jgi:hypothetical protein